LGGSALDPSCCVSVLDDRGEAGELGLEDGAADGVEFGVDDGHAVGGL
jgi:hypothetical protein